MINIGQGFQDNLIANKSAEIYIIINTHMGDRLYSMEVENLDPTTVLSNEALVTQFGNLGHSLTSSRTDLLAGFVEKRQDQFTVALNNVDFKITKLMTSEPFLTRRMTVYLGYTDIQFSEHIQIFTGIIDVVDVDINNVTLTAVES